MKKNFILYVFLLAFILRLAFALTYPVYPIDSNTGDINWYFATAQSLAAGQGYVWPETVFQNVFNGVKAGVSTAYFPVGFPLLISLVWRVFGPNLLLIKILNVLFSFGIVFFTYLLAQEIFCKNKKKVWLSLFLITLAPAQIIFAGIPFSETFYLSLLISSIYFFVRNIKTNQIFYLLASGVLLGFSSLVRGQSLLFPLVFLLTYFFIFKFSWRETLKRFVVILLLLLLIVLPWTLRNYRVMAYPFLVSSNAAVNLYIGNNQNARGGFSSPPAISATSEVDFAQKSLQAAKGFIFQHPIRFMLLVPAKIIRLFMADASLTFRQDLFNKFPVYFAGGILLLASLWYYFVLLASFWAFLLQRIEGNKYLQFIFLLVFYFAGLQALFFGGVRYNFPLAPFLAILAAFAVESILRRRSVQV